MKTLPAVSAVALVIRPVPSQNAAPRGSHDELKQFNRFTFSVRRIRPATASNER